MSEVWKQVPGFEGMYEASSLGRVRSVARTVKYTGGSDRRLQGRILKIHWRSRDNYGCVDFCINGKPMLMWVHKIIALTFIGPRPPFMEVRHKNGNQSNNRSTNILYGTKSQNQNDRVAHGTSNRGERCGNAKLTRRQILKIRKMRATGQFYDREIAEKFGIARRSVGNIADRKSWAWL